MVQPVLIIGRHGPTSLDNRPTWSKKNMTEIQVHARRHAGATDHQGSHFTKNAFCRCMQRCFLPPMGLPRGTSVGQLWACLGRWAKGSVAHTCVCVCVCMCACVCVCVHVCAGVLVQWNHAGFGPTKKHYIGVREMLCIGVKRFFL